MSDFINPADISEQNVSQNLQNLPKKPLWKKILKILAIAFVSIVIFCVAGYYIFLRPSLENYEKNAYDTSRQASLKSLAVSLSSYNIDTNSYPAEISSGCVNISGLGSYLPSVPTEPRTAHKNDGCNDINAESAFAYRVFKNEKNEDEYILSATMENEKNGNSAYDIDEIKKNPELLKNLQKGNGKYYIVSSVY